MNTTWQKTIVFNLIINVGMCFSSILIQYWHKNSNKATSPSTLKMAIYKQEVTFLSLVTWQEVVPLLANKKSHYYSFKMNIKVQSVTDTSIDN